MGTPSFSRKCSMINNKRLTSEDLSLLRRDIFVRQWFLEASRNNLQKMAEMLRHQPSLAKEKDPISGFTALHWAAKHGNADMAIGLVKNYGANVHEKSHGGYTALHLASKYRRSSTCKILVNELSANINLRDNYGRKPNYHTIKQSHSYRQQYTESKKKTSLSSRKSSQSSQQLPRFISLDGLH